jgi:DNA-binding NarL/FixJ family response regulator
MNPIRVLLVEDPRNCAGGAYAFCSTRNRTWRWSPKPCDGRAAVEYNERFRPQVVVMDLSMPEMNGLQATQAIKRSHPETAIVALHSSRRCARSWTS